MKARRRQGWMALGVPVLTGLGLLGAGLLLLPNRREILHAERRAVPARATPPAASPPMRRPEALAPTPPSFAVEIAHADAARLAALTAASIRDGRPVTTLQVAYDLIAAGRPAVALAYLRIRPDGQTATTWRLRLALLRETGHAADALALVDAATRRRNLVAPADLVAAAYDVGRPDLLVDAALRGAIPPPDVTLALDLARRADAAGRIDRIAALDRATRADWRGADPWLALRLAARAGDHAAALRAAGRLPDDQREAAQETVLRAAGDREGLRRLWLAQAARPGAATLPVAERLLAEGFREDAIAVLRQAATGRPVSDPAAQRLLYLIGPRPGAGEVAWLRRQSSFGDPTTQAEWLTAYAQRDRPAAALAFLSSHALAARDDIMLLRLGLARAARDDDAARGLASALLDGRPLDRAQLRAIAAALPADPALTQRLGRRRVAAGIADPRDTLDLAWAAWNAGDAATAARWLRERLAADADDLPALRLMADAQARIGGAAAARPWLERALAAAPANGRERAELLDRLGRHDEAIAAVRTLRAAAPADRELAALHARLLIARGQPGRAIAVLAP